MIFNNKTRSVHCMVLSSKQISPNMQRLVFGGPELTAWLADYSLQDPGAWVKVFPPGLKGRAYTIREIDYKQSTITIDFVLHDQVSEHNTISTWARNCLAGQSLNIAGPRSAQFKLEADAQWVWIAADLTALPAAIRIIESLPTDFAVYAVFVINDEEDQQPIQASANLRANWKNTALSNVLPTSNPKFIDQIQETGAKGQVWIAGEASWVRTWKNFWQDHHTIDCLTINCKGYWKRDEQDYKE